MAKEKSSIKVPAGPNKGATAYKVKNQKGSKAIATYRTKAGGKNTAGKTMGGGG